MTIIEEMKIDLPDAAATLRAGARIAPGLKGGMVVTLSGDLGAGKTTLIRGALRALGWEGPVKSPTYALLEHYTISRLYFYHFDFYRFDDPAEWENAGFAEYFRPDSVCLIEWPERAAEFITQVDLRLRLTMAEDGRTLSASAPTAEGRACLVALAATSI